MKKSLKFGVLYLLALALAASCSESSVPTVRSNAGTAASKSGGDLLYVGITHGVLILTYPEYKHVANLPTEEEWPTVCSDAKSGKVFVPDTYQIPEYAHGGTAPIGMLKAPAGYASLLGCSINPKNGDLAVVSYQYPRNGGVLLVYAQGRAFPAIYRDSAMLEPYYSAYDPNGNLFVMGYGLKGQRSVVPIFDELPAGSASLMHVRLDAYVSYPKKVQWDGKYVTLTNGKIVSRVRISGSHGYIVNTTILNGDNEFAAGITWIEGATILAPHGGDFTRHIGAWSYPAGGNANKVFPNIIKGDKNVLSDIAISHAPH